MVCPATISDLAYGWETSFGTVSTSINKPFGHGVKISNFTRKNNIERVFSMGSRNAQKLIEKKYEGAIGVEWTLANPWFFKGITGDASTTGGASDYTHTFAEDNALDSISIANNVYTSTAKKATLLGGKIGSATITAAVGELVKVKADIAYADETFSGTTSAAVSESFNLFSFAHGTLEMPDGTTLAMVQNCEITINNLPELIWGLGSRFAQCGVELTREYSGTISMALQQSTDILEDFYGASDGPASSVTELASLDLTFTNGLTGTQEESISLDFTGVQIDEESMPQDPTAVIMEDANIMMRSLEVTANNSTQTAA